MDAGLAGAEHRLEIRFVGSGSEYFRIWIVNLLLTLVTIGLYYPFAKARRLRYFHAATEVGTHALSFHGNPWKMFRGFLLVGALVAVYSLAGQVVAALWPALWHASLRFRLANTGWRGLRARFTGSRGGAYTALLPALALAVAVIGIGVLFGPEADGAKQPPSPALALLPLVMLIALPAIGWSIKRYQHAHYALAGEQSRFGVRLTQAYGLALRSFGVSSLVGLLFGVLVALAFGLFRALAADEPRGGAPLLGMAAALLGYLVAVAVVGAYFVARMQNLVWNGTRSEHLRFESQLRFRALALLNLRNWLLVLVTLGLYYPFAKVATVRLRLQALTLFSVVDPDTLLAAPGAAAGDAAGDAAADLLGIDIGL